MKPELIRELEGSKIGIPTNLIRSVQSIVLPKRRERENT
jgi:hypothetical protein